MTVHVDATGTAEARSVTATFDLQGGPSRAGSISTTPLGTVLAQARWSPGPGRPRHAARASGASTAWTH
jgi:hypothetical protein